MVQNALLQIQGDSNLDKTITPLLRQITVALISKWKCWLLSESSQAKKWHIEKDLKERHMPLDRTGVMFGGRFLNQSVLQVFLKVRPRTERNY